MADPNCTTCYLDGFEHNCGQVAHLMDIGAATFDTQATVRITHTNGRIETFQGRTNLPPGMDIRFTGAEARLAGIWFNWGMSNNFGVGAAAFGAMFAVSGSRLNDGGVFGFNSLAPMAPQNTTDLKINHAFGDAATAISQKRGQKKDACKDFFTQGRSLEEVSKIFKSFWQSAVYDPSLAAMAGTKNSGQGMAATLRLGSAFFLDQDNGTQGTGLSWSPVNNIYLTTLTNLTPRQNRALTILHEFAHALDLIPRDRDDPRQSIKNDAIIYEKCGHILDSLPWRD